MFSNAEEVSSPFLKERVVCLSLVAFSFSSCFVLFDLGVSAFFLLPAEVADEVPAFRFLADWGFDPAASAFGSGAGGSLGRYSVPPS